MEYANYPRYSNPPVDGFILQAPVSDREGAEMLFPDCRSKVEYAAKMIAEGRGGDCMPSEQSFAMLGAPVTAQRFYDLYAKG